MFWCCTGRSLNKTWLYNHPNCIWEMSKSQLHKITVQEEGCLRLFICSFPSISTSGNRDVLLFNLLHNSCVWVWVCVPACVRVHRGWMHLAGSCAFGWEIENFFKTCQFAAGEKHNLVCIMHTNTHTQMRVHEWALKWSVFGCRIPQIIATISVYLRMKTSVQHTFFHIRAAAEGLVPLCFILL